LDRESLDRPCGDLDFRHESPFALCFCSVFWSSGARFVEASWKRRDESHGAALRTKGTSALDNKSSPFNGLWCSGGEDAALSQSSENGL
jgi:hypothetical protein